MNRNGVCIEKDGLWLYEYDQDASFKRNKPNRIFACLREYCEIADGVTLGDIFNIVDALPKLKSFISQYSWCCEIDEFHHQAKEAIPVDNKTPEDEPLAYLRVYWHVSAQQHKKVNYFGMSPSFDGIGTGGTHYSVSYSPMYELAHLPVKLDTDFVIHRKQVSSTGEKILYKANACFSVMEVLDAIYDDISFVGGPDDNKAFIENMKEKIKKYNDNCN